jgi:hypothetical protein
MSPGQKKRLRRIALRASEPVKDALARGAITPRRADSLLYLSESEQQRELERLLHSQSRTQQRCRTAVRILREYLAAGRRDLAGFQRDLHQALSRAET